MMNPSEWPAGIDIKRHLLRRYSRFDRRAIEQLAAESADLEWYDVATAAYLAERPNHYPRIPGAQALRRLARRYVRYFRAELIEENRYIEVAARRALMGAASTGVTG
jgi:hypothetical protein